MMIWFYYLLLLLVLLIGWLINIVTLPGLWLMVGVHALYGWWTGWDVYVGWPSVLTLFILAGIAEIVEFGAGAAGSKVGGGRRRGMIGAIIGGIVGAIFFTGLVPIPVVGTIIGVCLGTFLGAAAAEWWDKDWWHSMRVGVGAAGGRFAGIVAKLGFGFVMFVIAFCAAFPIASTPAAAPTILLPPTTSPTTIPASIPATLPTTLP